MRRPRRLGVRTRLLLASVGAVAVALVVGVVVFNVVLGQRLAAGATSLARAQADAELSSLEIVDGKLSSSTGLDEGSDVAAPVWVFSGTTILERPRASAALTAAATALTTGPERSRRFGESVRLYALPVVHDGKRIGTVVAGVSLAPYNETATIALIGSLALAAVLLVGVALLSHWILGKALLPVSRMTEDAAAWSDHDLARRFDLGEPYDELTRLAATLDALLERHSASLLHEQRLTAEVSHELRTPLARIAAESELALRKERTGDDYRASLGAVHRNAEQMTRTVETLVAAARQEAGLNSGRSDARDGVRSAVEGVRLSAEAARMELVLSLPEAPVTVSVEPELLERIVQPLLDNAVRYGRTRVSVELSVDGKAAVVAVTDDGPGVVEDEVARIFDPGVRGAAGHDSRGAGLGLALARRLARTAGGEVSARTAANGGAWFGLRLPLA